MNKVLMQGISVADVLDSLTAHIAVLDPQARIIYVNDAWRRFGEDNGSAAASGHIGVNYLSICEAAVSRGDKSATAVLDGIKAVMSAKISEFSF